ncbi:MAG TPA: hypothetical protein VFO40_28090 [Chthoniobacterales bacterium]|nr:hypothetical protein [Chthoniobacterales bacterium]
MIHQAITAVAVFVLSAAVGLLLLQHWKTSSIVFRVLTAIFLTAAVFSALWCLIALIRPGAVGR